MQDKIQEIMEEVRMYGAAWFVSGQQQSISDKEALYFESKAQGHLLEIQSKLRKLVESKPSMRGPLDAHEVGCLIETAAYLSTEHQRRADFINGIRYAELAHNITNTTKERHD